jgi:hypothetical protein
MFEKLKGFFKEADIGDEALLEKLPLKKADFVNTEQDFKDSVFVKEHNDDDTVPADLMELFKK